MRCYLCYTQIVLADLRVLCALKQVRFFVNH